MSSRCFCAGRNYDDTGDARPEGGLHHRHRIAVMESGRILQVGSGEELYHRPNSKFVLDFLGASNRFQVVALPGRSHGAQVEAGCGITCRFPEAMSQTVVAGCASMSARRILLRLSQVATAVHRGPPATVEPRASKGRRGELCCGSDPSNSLPILRTRSVIPLSALRVSGFRSGARVADEQLNASGTPAVLVVGARALPAPDTGRLPAVAVLVLPLKIFCATACIATLTPG